MFRGFGRTGDVASVHRDRDKWRVRWRLNGEQQSQTFRTKSEAQAWASMVEADLARGVALDPLGSRVTFTEYADAWAANGAGAWRRGTRDGHHANLARVTFGARRLTAIRPTEIQAWVTALAGSYAPSTVESSYRTVAAVFRAAVDDRLIPVTPCKGIRLPKDDRTPDERARALDGATVTALIDALPTGPWADYARVMVLTGVRPAEAAGITRDRVNPLRRTLTIDRQLGHNAPHDFGPTKTAASVRTVPLSDAAFDVLARRIEDVAPGDLIFRTRQGGPLAPSTRSTAWGKARRDLAATETPLPAVGQAWHILRHTYASASLAGGMDIATLSRMLGHKTVAETLETYSHMIPGRDDMHRNAAAAVLGL